MKILYIFNEIHFSGAELMYHQAAPFLHEAGYEIYALATSHELGSFAKSYQEAGFIVEQICIENTKSYNEVKEFKRRLRDFVIANGIDIIHCQSNRLYFPCAAVAHSCGIRSIYSVNNMFNCKAWMWPYHKLLRIIAKNIYGCRFHSGSDTCYEHELKYWKNKTEIVYWWYNEKEYYPASEEEKNNARKDLGIKEDAFVLMTAGGCSHIKRHSDIIQASRVLTQKIPNFVFVHLGKGPLEDEERNLVSDLGLEENVMFCGNQSDFRKYLIAADVYTMTSTREGLSNATVDALACGIPAVLYHVTGLKDYNINGNNTYQIEEDSGKLAEAVLELYNNSSLRDDYTRRGKLLVNEKYQSSKNIKKLIDLFYA